IKKILFKEDDVVKVGQAIAIIEIEGEASSNGSAPAASSEAKSEVSSAPTAAAEKPQSEATSTEKIAKNSDSEKFFSALVRSIAEKEGLSMQELESISGSGLNDRVTNDDLLNYIQNRVSQAASATTSQAQAAPKAAPEAQK